MVHKLRNDDAFDLNNEISVAKQYIQRNDASP